MNQNMIDDMDKRSSRRFTVLLFLGMLGLALGAVKVRNELRMTKEYNRQAIALERQAAALERMSQR